MQIKIFTVPIHDDGSALEEMNRFLRGQRVLEVEQYFRDHPTGAAWCFCVQYVAGSSNSGAGANRRREKKVDYKEILDEATFNRFSQMRVIRKQIAEAEGLPAFAVFTDADLAELAKMEEMNAEALLKMDGINQKKAKRFGQPLIDAWQKQTGPEQ